ncbi:MAG: HIT family protein, partial [Lentisphaerae bacterium]|nr:HIT family protein [Lentisphaerota bacterium]
MKNCVFCKIIAGELGADKVYEDDLVVAVLDIAPLVKGHALIIPKQHHNSLTTLPADAAARMMKVAPKVAMALVREVDGDGFNLMLANGSCAGQVVPHVHLHVLPRHPEDGLVLPARTVEYESAAEKAELLEQARARLSLHRP